MRRDLDSPCTQARAGYRSCQSKLGHIPPTLRRYARCLAPSKALSKLTAITTPGFRRSPCTGGPTEPLHCIYNLGLGVVAQGDRQVLLGEESIDYGPGQSMLTIIDLPVVSHVTRASGAEPFLGMMLTLDVRSIVQMASEMDEVRRE